MMRHRLSAVLLAMIDHGAEEECGLISYPPLCDEKRHGVTQI
jgi:hypothetical protein